MRNRSADRAIAPQVRTTARISTSLFIAAACPEGFDELRIVLPELGLLRFLPSRRGAFLWASAPRPQPSAREPRAGGERPELRPGDLGTADARPQAAIGAAHDVLAADELRVFLQPVGD